MLNVQEDKNPTPIGKDHYVTGRFRRLLMVSAMILAAGSFSLSGVKAEGALDVNDAKLDSFVDAYNAVHEVANTAMQDIKGAETDSDLEALKAELKPKFEAAIEGTDGITLAEFREIEQAAVQDENLGQRIIEKMQAAAHAH